MANTSLKAFLKDADEAVRKAAADALNEAAKEMKAQIKTNMAEAGIVTRSGRLRASVKSNRATAKNPRIVIKSEVYAEERPQQPGKRNPAMRGRYKYGVPYGRILEFSPRIRKPFFYKAWYEKRDRIKADIIQKIGEAWNGAH